MTSTPEDMTLTMCCTNSWLEMSVFVKCWLVIHSSTLFWCTLFTCSSLGRGRDSGRVDTAGRAEAAVARSISSSSTGNCSSSNCSNSNNGSGGSLVL